MPGLKNSKPNGLIKIADFNNRVVSHTDASYDYFTRFYNVHGYIYQIGASGLNTYTMPMPLFIGPCNEVTFQIIGTAGNIASAGIIQGSIDGQNFVNVNLVSSADGFLRIQSKYRYIKIAGVTGLDATSALYMMLS